MDQLTVSAVSHGDDRRLRDILERVCRITGMGFAAIARVTEERWIACQVADELGFGLEAGGELKIEETICDEIRQWGEAIFIDHVLADPRWRAHPVPAQYGFQSYVSIPLRLSNGAFYGTLCALDPQPRAVSEEVSVAILSSFAQEVERILSEKVLHGLRNGDATAI